MLSQNVVHGNTLATQTADGEPITFAEWTYLGDGKFQRRDFSFDVLMGKREGVTPLRIHAPMLVVGLARLTQNE